MRACEKTYNMTDAQKKELLENLDALYAYLDFQLDNMSRDEIRAWTEVLKNIDPEFSQNPKNE